MSLKHLAWTAGVMFLVVQYGRSTDNWWPFVALLSVGAGGYFFSLLAHPVRDCWRCKGSGRHRGAVWDYARRKCGSCDGKAYKPRWGVRVLGLPHEAWGWAKR